MEHKGTASPSQGHNRKKDFTVRLSADVLRTLSPKEQRLWVALRRLADAKTGEVRFGDDWIDGKRLDREARMGTRQRKETMRGLIAKGLARMQPVYVVRPIADRLSGHVRNRKVRDGFHYFVSESPRENWVSTKVPSENPHKHRRSTKVPSTKVPLGNRSRKEPAILISDPKKEKAQLPSRGEEGEHSSSSFENFILSAEGDQLQRWLLWKLSWNRALYFPCPVPLGFWESLRKDWLKRTDAMAVPYKLAMQVYESNVAQHRAEQPLFCTIEKEWIVEEYPDGSLMLPPWSELTFHQEEPVWHPKDQEAIAWERAQKEGLAVPKSELVAPLSGPIIQTDNVAARCWPN